MKKPKKAAASQIDRFREAARELGTDDSEERFDERLKRVAKALPADDRLATPRHRPAKQD